MYLRPPNYKEEESKWQSHPDVAEITEIQALGQMKNDGWLEEAVEVVDEDSDQEGDEDESESDEQAPASSNKFALLEDD